MSRFKDQAICLRDIDWSETSQVVVLMTEAHGLLRGLAKGSKRQSPSSVQRFSGGIELLTRGQIVATTRPTRELATLTEWDLQDDFYHLRQSLEAQRLGMYAADLVMAMFGEEDPHPRTFAAMARLLAALKAAEVRQAALLGFQWDVLEDAGFKPELERDVHTNVPLGEAKTYTFDPVAGGLTGRNGIADWRVRRKTVELLRTVEAGESLERFETEAVARGNKLLCSYARSILGKQLPTMGLVLG